MFRKLFSAVKKLFRGQPSRRKGKKRPRRSLRRPRPLARPRRKVVTKVKKTKKAKKKRPVVKKKVPKKPKPSKAKMRLVKKVSAVLPKNKQAGLPPKGVLSGQVTHYFSKIMVCVIKVTHVSFSVGDQLRIQGSAGGFTQKVVSLQIESQDVRVAPKGQLVGLKVAQPTRVGDKVFKL
jgi:hypothetical protein